jgi:WD40 repeat protein
MQTLRIFCACLVGLFAIDTSIGHCNDPGDVEFSKQIEPILRAKCQGCHQPAKAQGGYVITSFDKLLLAGDSGKVAVVPGDPDASELIRQITPIDGVAAMPQNSPALHATEIELIRRWIAQGSRNDSKARGPKYDSSNRPSYARPPVTTAIAWSTDGKWLAINGFHEVALLDAQSYQAVQRLVGLSERVQSIAFSPDSKRLAVTGGSPGRFGEVQIWDVETGELSLSHQVTYDTLYGGSFSPDGKLFAFGASDRVVRAIDVETGVQKLHQGAHEDWSLATVFNPSGSHLVSAGRDMSVKLTEVATERFVDNVTSITPGELKGGVNALAMHPSENQVLVGGADGTPKIYRIFRETERRIGDDSNLIRKFAAMNGRIFDVSISADGKLFAVASTLDGKSQVMVYPYDFTGEVPAEIKATMSKTVDQRNDEEKKAIERFNSQTSPAVSQLEITDSIYAVAIHPDGKRLAVGGASGVVRVYAVPSGEFLKEFSPVPIDTKSDDGTAKGLPKLEFATGLPIRSELLPSAAIDQQLLPTTKLTGLRVDPPSLSLSSPLDYSQLVITAQYADGKTADVTRLASVHVADADKATAIQIDSLGVVRPATSNQPVQTQLKIAFQDVSLLMPVQIAAEAEPNYDFVRDVNPILSRLGCNAGTCHGAQQGKNGFQLSLRGYDPVGDIRALSDDLSARRLNPAAPDASVMLLKPVGAIPHEGGVLLTADSSYYRVLQQWIAQGAKLNRDSRKVQRIEITPNLPILEAIGASQQFRVTAFYANGSTRDVTHETVLESSNSEVCQSLPGARVKALRRGEAAMLARYEGAYAAATVTVMGDRQSYRQTEFSANNKIDELVAEKWQRMKIEPSALCDDPTFLRRVRLDLTGLPPTIEELKSFLEDARPTTIKRQEKIDQLIGSEDYIEHWTNKWADLLQVNAKFLAPEGAAAFRQWIRTAVAENWPYDQFVSRILTASGSNKDNPAASYFKILRDPDLMMENTTHLFLAVRFNCNKCHDHPFERWTQDQYYQLAAYFSRAGLKEDPASNNRKIGGSAVEGAKPYFEEVYDKNDGEMIHARTKQPMSPEFPFACEHTVPENATRRQQLAAWITAKNNPYFATSFVNRLWGYLTGTGLVEPLDDIRAGNPPSNPELLKFLADQFIESSFDTRHIQRMICNSRTYQLSVATNPMNADDTINYSHAKARRLPAEVLYDTVYRATGTKSAIPGVEPGTRAAQLPDVAFNLADGFLNNLGRPVRESACECERSHELQLGPVMALVSGPTIGTAISDAQNALANMAGTSAGNANTQQQLIEEVYLRILNRYPTATEIEAVGRLEQELDQDHQQLLTALEEKTKWWAIRKQELEAQRLLELEKTRAAVVAREQEIAPARQKMEEERQAKIAAAQQALNVYGAEPLQIANKYLKSYGKNNNWFPLAASSAQSTNMCELTPQADRSIIASGKAEAGTYTIRYRTPLRGIRGFRLEAVPIEGLAGGGPGLPGNGNFVVTEVEVSAAALADTNQKSKLKIASAKTDFAQQGFSAAAAIDGNNRDGGGWAVHPRGGCIHWLTGAFAEPIDLPGGVELTFDIHQYHPAESHRLGRFRISVTTDEGEVLLGLPEELAAVEAIPEQNRKPEQIKTLVTFLEKSDQQWNDLRAAVAAAQAPLPNDEPLMKLRSQVSDLEKPTPEDAKLVQLQTDVAASTQQIANRRLTIVQDLAWALINSPAFLFNH